jgi:hypothetical protein
MSSVQSFLVNDNSLFSQTFQVAKEFFTGSQGFDNTTPIPGKVSGENFLREQAAKMLAASPWSSSVDTTHRSDLLPSLNILGILKAALDKILQPYSFLLGTSREQNEAFLNAEVARVTELVQTAGQAGKSEDFSFCLSTDKPKSGLYYFSLTDKRTGTHQPILQFSIRDTGNSYELFSAVFETRGRLEGHTNNPREVCFTFHGAGSTMRASPNDRWIALGGPVTEAFNCKEAHNRLKQAIKDSGLYDRAVKLVTE